MMPPVRTLLGLVLDGAACPDSPIMTFVDAPKTGVWLEEFRSYKDLLDNGCAIAGALGAAGLKNGDAFAIIMRNHPEFVDAMVASEIAGAVFVPIDPRTRGDRLAYMLRFSQCRGAIVSRDVAEHLRSLRESLPDLRFVWVVDGPTESDDVVHLRDVVRLANSVSAPMPRPLDEPMQMLFTSGTTGHPKAILAPHARFASVAALGALVGLEDHDRLFTGLSLTHANAQLITLGNALSARLPLVITRQFTKSRLWEILAHYECTTFNLLGGMATAILAEPPGDFDRAHRVRFVLSAGMPEKMWRAFERRFGVKVFEFFGAAEGGLTLNPPGVGPVGSIGKAAPGSVCEILDDHDRIAAPGVRGEICFRNADGTVAPVTYFGDAQASAAKTRGGWFRTGDIGWKDEAGWIYFSHRDGHSTRRNGAFIDIAEIETAMADLPGIEDVHVYGVSTIDNAPGEKEVVAAVVPGVGFCGAIEVLVQSAKLVGASSAPSFIQLVDEIPKTASEKPQARHLIDMIRNGSTPVFNRSGPIKLRLAEGGRI